MAASTTALAFGFDRYVRARIASEAERRHLDIQVGAVRPAWIGARLVDVRVRARGVGAIVHFDEARIDLDRSLALSAVRVRGGSVDVSAPRETVVAELRAWRAALPASLHDATTSARVPISIEGVAFRWPTERVDATALGAHREPDGSFALRVGAASVDLGAISVHVEDARIALDPSYALRNASAARVTATYDASTTPTFAKSHAEIDESKNDGASPELRAVRARARTLAAMIARALPNGADVAIDSLAIAPRVEGDGLSLGPGSLSVTRSAERATISFTTLPGSAATPFTASADLPIDRGDVRVTLDGGPVPLALLGLRDGVAGLGDLDRANVAGKAEIVLAANDERISFDVDLRAHDVAVFHRRLAKEIVHGLDLGAKARGSYDAAGVLRIVDADLSMGNAHVLASGSVDTSAERAGASLAIEIPRTDCQALLDSAPAALIPTVHGVHLDGSLAARARFAFTVRTIDALSLKWSVDSTCRVVDVPAHLARDRFKRAFAHKRYSPRGEIREETTGPGTAGWTPLGAMSRFLPLSIVMTEDGGLFRRDGFNRAQIDYAIATDLKERRFARGASTLTMQLAKNLFLTRDKVLARKLEELVLTLYLSQHFSKDEILELYLNIVEFGPDVYGVRAASAHYFGKGPSNVTLAEALFLASMLPSPLKLHGLKNPNGVPEAYVASFHHLMDLAKQSGLISESDVDAGKAETIVFR